VQQLTQPPQQKTKFKITINSTDPTYFYCSQVSHCGAGMVGAINAPDSGNTFAAYLAAAEAYTGDPESPAAVAGGVLETDDDGDSSSSSSASETKSATSASATSAAASVSSSVASVTSAASSAASSVSSAAATSSNAAAVVGRMSYEMLGLAGVAGGVAVMMQ
jgi:hypothetical protein